MTDGALLVGQHNVFVGNRIPRRHGKAWGTLVWNGQVVQENTQITGPLKRVWALVKAPPELPGEEGAQWLNVVRLKHIVDDGTFPVDNPPAPVPDYKGRGRPLGAHEQHEQHEARA